MFPETILRVLRSQSQHETIIAVDTETNQWHPYIVPVARMKIRIAGVI
jgi:hypothetical protein